MLKTSDYCKYLPYDLQVQFEGIDCYLYGLQANNICLLNTCDNYSSIDDNMPHVLRTKPCLRPISELAEEITHNGKTIIPIVELAKLANTGSEKYVCDFSKDFDFVNCTLICEKYFSFIFYHNVFYLENKKGENVVCTEQPKFFEWCYEHHFWLGDQSYFDKGLILKLKK